MNNQEKLKQELADLMIKRETLIKQYRKDINTINSKLERLFNQIQNYEQT